MGKPSAAQSRLLAGLILALCVANANASSVTYSFTGGGDGAYQSTTHFTRDYFTGDTVDTTSAVPDPTITASMSFTVVVSNYNDLFPETGRTIDSGSDPWLYGASTFNGQLFSQSVSTSPYDNRLDAYDGAGATSGQIMMGQRTEWFSDIVTDSLGRWVTWTRNIRENFVSLSGEVTLGLVDGQELPVSLGSYYAGTLQQTFYIETNHAGDNGSGSFVTLSTEFTERDSWAPILSASITPVPEADTYAMMLAGLGLIGARIRRRLAAH